MNEVTFYYLVTVLCTAVNTYILYRYYHYFFQKRISPRAVEIGSYVTCFLLNILVYLVINIPLITLLSNIFMYTALAFNYEGKVKHKIFAGIFWTFLYVFVETTVVFLTTSMSFNIFGVNQWTESYGQIFITIFTFMAVEIIGRRRNIKSGVNIPFIYWIAVLITPICSFFIMVYLITIAPEGNPMLSVCCLLFLLINVAVFFLYGRIIDDFDKRMNAEILRQQNRYYANLTSHMRSANEATAAMRHDWKHHLITMERYIKNEEYADLNAYFDTLKPEIATPAEIVNSGNDTIDAILNYKLEEAKRADVSLHYRVKCNDEREFDDTTLTIVLANLLDNAIEAAAKNEKEKDVSLFVTTEKDVLMLKIKNKYEGELKPVKDTFLTTKSPAEEHGKGLKSVINAVEKNGGVIDVETDNQTFTVSALVLPKK